MRNVRLGLALLLLLGWTSWARANVARYYFANDPDYARAKVWHIVVPSLLTAWVIGWAHWARQGTWQRKLLALPLIGLPCFQFLVAERGGSVDYFLAGTRPATVGSSPVWTNARVVENMPRESPDPQMVGFLVALVVAVCCIVGVAVSATKKRRLAIEPGEAEKAP